MPSHSKKQHNFMEAIAHSPSFAKKAGVPQSVGKDYAAADKGKTFGKGGEMKESKAMIGKEVAFMKKKGAPAKMIKHEMSEMKGMKAGGRVRKMAGGGEPDMSMGRDSALSNRSYGYEEEKEQGAKNLEGIKNFFGFGKKESKPAAASSVSSSTAPAPAPAPAPTATPTRVTTAAPPRNRTLPDIKNPESDDNDKKLSGPQFASSIVDRGEGEYSGNGLSAVKKPVVPRRKPVTVSETKETKSVTAAPADTSYSSLEERRAAKKPAAPKRGFGALGLTDEDRKANRDAVSGFFGRIGKGIKDFYNMETPAERRSRERKIKEEEQHVAKGGKVSAYAQGGFTRAADGVAKKGRTQPKMVKMASGGFVKNADGCAQRGKTKAFQVKMNRGGKC